ncbi:MAG: hypothetical protein WAQ98_10815 [Blastocatellia bacterium]
MPILRTARIRPGTRTSTCASASSSLVFSEYSFTLLFSYLYIPFCLYFQGRSVQKTNNLKQEISTIAYNLEHELSEMIAEARESVA